MLVTEVNKLPKGWKSLLINYEDELKHIDEQLIQEKNKYEPSLKIFPPDDKILEAFRYFDISGLKVVFVGQDCYHGKGQANGLCFSVPEEIPNPPSLRNILKEITDDIGIERNNSDFIDLAKQGILLLNSALTVREKCPESHTHIWNKLTDYILKDISDLSDKVIFVLWGAFAKSKKKFIDESKHFILESVHPSPFSSYRGFFGCKHFSKINQQLKAWNKDEIIWAK